MTFWRQRFLPASALALVLALVFAFPGAPTLGAQDGVVNTPPPPSDNPQDDQAPDQSDTVIKSRVNVVQVFFNVKDKHSALVPGLVKDDFQILEDGKPQTIKYFSAEANQPLTLGILVDTSGSQERVLGMEKEMGALFLNRILRDTDQAFLINFDVNVELGQDFTNSKKLLKDALEKTKINTGGASCGGIPGIGGGPIPCGSSGPRGTLLFDAVDLSAHDMLYKEVGRKAVILLTDGEDQGSRIKIKEAIEIAQKADVICYVILAADRGFYGGMYSGDSDMHKMTEATGGRVIDVGNKPEKLRDAFDQIAQELRSQYNIGYTPTNTVADGAYRKLEIKSKPDLKIQARKGYYAVQQ
jgi:VWFA-related protein